MTATAARQAVRLGKNLIGGQEVYFVVVDSKSGNPEERINLVDFLQPETRYDVEFYLEQLRRAVRSVLHPFFGDGKELLQIEAYQGLLFEM